MFIFFHSWRRLVGSLMLILALAVLVMWMRSCLLKDSLNWQVRGKAHTLISVDSGLSWTTYDAYDSTTRYWRGSTPIGPKPYHGWWQFPKECDLHWHRAALGFHFGAATKNWASGPQRSEYWLIPYWAIVALLTLVSGYLLLTKSSFPCTPQCLNEHNE